MNDQWDMSGIQVVDDNFVPPVANPEEDRITAILQKRAQPIQFSPDQMQDAGQAAVHYALGGRTRGISDILDSIRNPILAQQDREYDSAKGLYDLFEEKRARGDRQAQAVYDAMGKITSDPDAQGKLLEWMHALPEKVDPNNPNKLLMLLARGKRELGIQTDFERGEQERALEIKMKEAQIRASDALAKHRLTGGGGGGGTGVTGFVYNKIAGALGKAGVEITPLIDLQITNAARNGLPKGSTITINGQDIAIESIPGMTEVLEDHAMAEGFGTSFGKAQGDTVFDLPRVRNVSNEAITAIDRAIADPALKNVTGLMSKVPIIPGSERSRADAILDQVGGRVFLTAYDSLKGGGQITEIEGVKAEQAIAAIGSAQKYEDVVMGLQLLREAIINSVRTKEAQATMTPEQITGEVYQPPTAGGLSSDKQKRLQELRAKRDAGTLR